MSGGYIASTYFFLKLTVNLEYILGNVHTCAIGEGNKCKPPTPGVSASPLFACYSRIQESFSEGG